MASDVINASNSLPPLVTQPVSARSEQSSSRGSVEEASVASRAEEMNKPDSLNKASQAERERELLTPELKAEQLHNAVGKINEVMLETQRSLSFSVDEDANQVVVRVMNTDTDEVIRQIPNEEALEFAKHLESMMGLIFNDKA